VNANFLKKIEIVIASAAARRRCLVSSASHVSSDYFTALKFVGLAKSASATGLLNSTDS